MDFSQIPLFGMLVTRMEWLGERQRVLSDNVVNADTPGYEPKDLDSKAFQRLLEKGQRPEILRVTHPAHISPTGASGGRVGKVVESDTADTVNRRSGNTVVVERELMKVAETAMNYRLTTSLYRKHVSMIRMALGRGGRA